MFVGIAMNFDQGYGVCKERGGASKAVRCQAEPGNEKKERSVFHEEKNFAALKRT